MGCRSIDISLMNDLKMFVFAKVSLLAIGFNYGLLDSTMFLDDFFYEKPLIISWIQLWSAGAYFWEKQFIIWIWL